MQGIRMDYKQDSYTLTFLFSILLLLLTSCGGGGDDNDVGNGFDIESDFAEPNDSLSQAYTLQPDRNYTAYSHDPDYYRISVPSDRLRVVFHLTYSQREGDINVQFKNSNGNTLVTSDDQTGTETIDFTVQISGTYYFLVYAGGDSRYSFSYTLNSTTSQPPISAQPDLVVTSFTAPSNGNAGGSIDISNTVRNTGTTSSGPFNVGVYLSSNTNITNSDTLLGTRTVRSLSPGANSSSSNNSLSIPSNVSTGTYYLGVIADISSAVAESDETNNVSTTRSISISGVSQSTDDNYEENDTQASSAGPIAEGSWIDGVQADDDWYAIDISSGYELVNIDLRFTHSDGDIDLGLYDSSGTRIASSRSTSDNEAISYEVPSFGRYYLRIYYSNAGNSYRLWWDDVAPTTTPPSSLPDLSISSITVPANGVAGSDVSFSDTTSNSGSNITTAFRVGVYLSSNSVISTSDQRLATRTIGSLASNANDTGIGTVTLPGDVIGAYYIGAIADIDGDINESDESNNTSSGRMINITSSPTQGDDVYEDNDTLGTAYHLSENTLISGIQSDDDWYEIDVTTYYERVIVDLRFTDSDGDIDIWLTDSSGNILATSTSTTDNEIIDYVVSSSGLYYLRVYYGDAGNSYTLTWDDVQP